MFVSGNFRPGRRSFRLYRQRNQRAGFSLIELLIVVTIIGIIAAIAIPNLAASRAVANQASAVQSLRTYHNAQMTYRAGKGFLINFQLLQTRTNGIDRVLAGIPAGTLAIKSGYAFTVGAGMLPNSNDPTSDDLIPSATDIYQGYHIQANPLQINGLGRTGSNGYYVDHSGVIRVKVGQLNADSNDLPIGSESGS